MRYLIVDPGQRRKGIASSLVAYAKWRRPSSWGKTKEVNNAMLAVFEKEGYKRDADRDGDGWLAFSWER